MLTHLSVRDFAIVESVEIALDRGLTVVTGETGAGKSLLVDALLLLSGSRADSAVVRAGCERAELAAEFDLAALPGVAGWLAEQELDDDGACILRRVIRAAGTSRAWINGRPVTLQTLAGLAAQLVGIHGQHEHQALLERPGQLDLLDNHGRHLDLRRDVAAAAAAWQALIRQQRELLRLSGEDSGQVDLLRHHLAELRERALAPAAYAALEQEHHRLAHQGDTLASCAAARGLLDEDGESGALAAVVRARQLLERASAADPALGETVRLLAAAEVELQEVVATLDAYLDGAESDPDRLARLDAQLSGLHDLARKHRVDPSALADQRDRLAGELEAAENADQRLAAMAGELAQAGERWRAAAAALTAARTATAARLGDQVTAIMAELGMAGGRFRIELVTVAEAGPDPVGAERCEFLVSANPGQAPRPLRKVASGGELSRIALALEVAALGDDPVPTMVFDEVDAGVGGAVAEILGQKLRRLGGHAQVLCVTHLAQVAAQGHNHLQVRKHAAEGATSTAVAALVDEPRMQEIARMLGGVEITATTLAHARQMLGHGATPAAGTRKRA